MPAIQWQNGPVLVYAPIRQSTAQTAVVDLNAVSKSIGPGVVRLQREEANTTGQAGLQSVILCLTSGNALSDVLIVRERTISLLAERICWSGPLGALEAWRV